MRILAVAVNTFREAVRDRILYLLLFFALLMIACSKVLSLLSVGSPEKIIVDVGLGSISFFSMLIAVFMGIGLIRREIERRTIYAVVTKPLSREAFVVGKFLGMFAAIAVNHGVMTLGFLGALWVWATPFTGAYAMVLALALLEAALVLALAILYSALASPILASLFTLVSYAVGHWLDGLRLVLTQVDEGWAKSLLTFAYRVFPDLELLNLKNQVVFPPSGPEALMSQFVHGLIYGGCYTVAVLLLATLAFRRKDFL